MTHRIERKKWILYRHTNNLDIISAVAANLKNFSKCSISEDDKKNLLEKLKDLDYYKERNPDLPLDSINHRINTLAYYMFGYKDKIGGENKFLFSPLGNLFLKYIVDSDKTKFIFLTMLWALQFKHPHGGSDEIFNLFPFRLIFKLLNDKRLNEELYVSEVAYFIVFLENANTKTYDKLVKDILNMRTWSDEEIEKKFKKEEHVYVNAVYEWDYYVSNLLESAGILIKSEGESICSLKHGTSTTRFLKKNIVKLSPELKDYCKKLLSLYPFDEQPLDLYDKTRATIDIKKEIYSFYPKILLEEIKETYEEFNVKLLELPRLIEQYADNEGGAQTSLFEDILEEGFNMFFNVTAKKIAGAGNTDIECVYITKKKKFAVEAKSTKNKLSNINSGRLARHREKIGGEYTIVITPRYVPSVKYDIKTSEIVIITASTFSEYLYNNIINNIRDIDYEDFDEIIMNNLGKDVSVIISDLTMNKFAVSN